MTRLSAIAAGAHLGDPAGMKSLIFALLMAASAQPVHYPRTYLLSLRGLPVDPNGYVSAFSIDTWGVEVLATCQIPPGWTITAGKSADPSGEISGAGSLGVTWLDRKRLDQLEGIVLVRLRARILRRAIRMRSYGEPATFHGTASIGHYGDEIDDRKVRLTWRNIRLTPAKRCPPPRF